jgi:GntR family transcriptional regulator
MDKMISNDPSQDDACNFVLGVDIASYVPYYEQIVMQVRSGVQAQSLKPGGLFYSEGELSKKLGISKMPIRQAYRRLRSQGLLVTAKGRKPVIGAGTVPLEYNALRSFSEEVRERGQVPSTKLLEVIRIPANAEVGVMLKLDDGAAIYRLRRLRFIDGVPAVLETTYLPASLFPGLETQPLETESLYAVIEKTYKRPLKMAEERLSATTAEAEEATLLGIEAGFPLLVAQRLLHDAQGELVEFGHSLIRADHYYVHVTLKRN